jgi:hypothetical protein
MDDKRIRELEELWVIRMNLVSSKNFLDKEITPNCEAARMRANEYLAEALHLLNKILVEYDEFIAKERLKHLD